MKAVVFGGTGFIGSHVVEQLSLSNNKVTVVVRENSKTTFLESLGVSIRRIDFQNLKAITQVIEGEEIVFNCLANPRLHQSHEDHKAVEIYLTQKILKCAIEAKAKRFIQLSTVQVYGFQRPSEPINEYYPCVPTYVFNQVAYEREQSIKKVAEKGEIELVILRPSNTTGKRDISLLPPYLALHKFRLFPVFGDGTARFSCVDTRDIGKAMVWLGELVKATGETYLLRGYDLSWIEFKEALDKFFNRKSFLLKTPTPIAMSLGFLMEKVFPYGKEPPLTRFAVDVLTTSTLFDDSKIRQTGFKTEYNFEDTLRDVTTG